MPKGLNKLQPIGNVGGEPESRFTQGGDQVTGFSVAVNRQTRGGEETDWFRVTCWRQLAEIADRYVEKGARVYVEGRLQIRKYTDRDGVERTAVEVVAHELILLGGKGERREAEPTDLDEVPF